jgi:hypothetical protein
MAGGPMSSGRAFFSARVVLIVAVVMLVGFQIATHIHWFSHHELGQAAHADDHPCPVSVRAVRAPIVGVASLKEEAANLTAGLSSDAVSAFRQLSMGNTVPDPGCGDGNVDLVIAVLGAPTERSRIGRNGACMCQ